MALQLWTGFEDPFFSEFERSINRAFEPVLAAGRSRSTNPQQQQISAWHPMDIHETKDKFVIVADVPGMSPEDIHVELKDRVLTVSGEKKVEVERNADEKGVRTYRKERTFNKFTRSFVLPDETQAEGIAAHVNNGVLTLDIPKKPEEPPKVTKIPVLGSAKPAAQIEGAAAPTNTTTTPSRHT